MSMFDFHYEMVGKDKDIVEVVLSGSLDADNSQYLLECVKEHILDGRKKLILNCGQLSYISSMGLGVLVQVHSKMKKIGGEVELAALQSTVIQILSMVRFDRIFHIHPTVADAIAAHGG